MTKTLQWLREQGYNIDTLAHSTFTGEEVLALVDKALTINNKSDMNADRIKEIQQQTAHPNSTSVYQALMQVWNECAQESQPKHTLSDEEIYEKYPEIEYDDEYGMADAVEMDIMNSHKREGAKWARDRTNGTAGDTGGVVDLFHKSSEGGYWFTYTHPDDKKSMVASQGETIPDLLRNLADAHELISDYLSKQRKDENK